jgi:hypothetical protein
MLQIAVPGTVRSFVTKKPVELALNLAVFILARSALLNVTVHVIAVGSVAGPEVLLDGDEATLCGRGVD